MSVVFSIYNEWLGWFKIKSQFITSFCKRVLLWLLEINNNIAPGAVEREILILFKNKENLPVCLKSLIRDKKKFNKNIDYKFLNWGHQK